MIVGHPFKGGMPFSTAYLEHPDMKRFNICDDTLFVKPRPDAWASALASGSMARAAASVPSFGDFFATYFAGRSFNVAEPKCTKMLEGMKRCYENHSTKAPVESCQYYIQGFERMACGNN